MPLFALLPWLVGCHNGAKEGESGTDEGPEGTLRVTPEQPGFAEKIKTAENLMGRYRNALRELAK